MATTYTLINSNVLTSSAASVTFSSIPATYTDLVLRASTRADSAGYQDDLRITFNGATSGYSTTYISATGTTASSGRTSSTIMLSSYQDAATATSNTFSSFEMYIPSYTASQNKPVGYNFAVENNSTTQNIVEARAGLYSSTTAISSITLAIPGGQLMIAGSSFYLYGISNA